MKNSLLNELLDLHWTGEGWAFDLARKGEAIEVTHENEKGDTVKSLITEEKVVKAFADLAKDKQTHCGDYAVVSDPDEWDSCIIDLVFQQAIFGEVIFG
jgi:hypothetical protein